MDRNLGLILEGSFMNVQPLTHSLNLQHKETKKGRANMENTNSKENQKEKTEIKL